MVRATQTLEDTFAKLKSQISTTLQARRRPKASPRFRGSSGLLVTKATIAPSILAADFSCLGAQLRVIEASSLADRIHVDIMDGHFVPTMSFGPMVCDVVQNSVKLPIDVHLMVKEPSRFVEECARTNAACVTVHVEACPHIHRDLSYIKSLGMKAGVTLNPGTPLSAIEDVLEIVDLVLIMSVNPGWGGQPFLESSLRRIAKVRSMIAATGRAAGSIEIEVDGGINAVTARSVVDAGGQVLVAGSAVFRHPNGIEAGLRALHEAIDKK